MAAVVNKDNNVGTLTAAHLSRIIRSEIKKWPDGKAVILVLHKNSAGKQKLWSASIKWVTVNGRR